MNALFATYIRLYPGKEDVIFAAIAKGDEVAQVKGLTGKAYLDELECAVLDVL